MPNLIIDWRILDKLSAEEQKEFALGERYRTALYMSVMSMRRRIKIMSELIDTLRLRKNYWISLGMK